MEYSKLADGYFTVSAASTAQNVILPFQPNYVEITCPARVADGVTRAWWLSSMGAGTAMVVTTTSATSDVTTYASSGGITNFSAGYPQYGSQLQIASITKNSTAPVITTVSAHGLSSGAQVILTGLFETSSTGMPQICGIPFTITVTGTTTFTIAYNTNQSNYTALSADGLGSAYVVQILYPQLYFPGVNVISALSLSGTSLTVTTTTPHNLVVGSTVAFRIPSAWGSTQLNSPTSLGQPIYGQVTSITSAYIYVCTVSVTSITSFSTNPTVAQALAGLSFPQSVAIGDQNTGAYTSSYTPTTVNPISIGGAFQNNTYQGFTVGTNIITSSNSDTDVIYWRAYFHDLTGYTV